MAPPHMRGVGDDDVGDTSWGFDRRGDFYFANFLSSRTGATYRQRW